MGSFFTGGKAQSKCYFTSHLCSIILLNQSPSFFPAKGPVLHFPTIPTAGVSPAPPCGHPIHKVPDRLPRVMLEYLDLVEVPSWATAEFDLWKSIPRRVSANGSHARSSLSSGRAAPSRNCVLDFVVCVTFCPLALIFKISLLRALLDGNCFYYLNLALVSRLRTI